MYPFDAMWDPSGDVSRARIGRELSTALVNHDALMNTMYRPTATALTDTEIQRIAEAVVDEQERRASHPLFVSAEDRRRWLR